MQRSAERDLEILNAIAEGTPLTQRALAQRVGIALGLTNLYLKRLAKNGYIKIVDFPRKPAARKRLRYILTRKGIGEKTRLTYEHLAYAVTLYRRTRETLRSELGRRLRGGVSRVALYGTEEAAELAYLTLREVGIDPCGVFGSGVGTRFIGMTVQPVTDLAAHDCDAVIVATFEAPDALIAELLALGIAHDKIVTFGGVQRHGADAPMP